MTDNDKADLLFSDAFNHVRRKHTNFASMIMAGHMQIAKKTPGVDPLVSAAEMDCGLAMEPGTAKHTKARLQMVEAVLHVWYKVPPDLQSAVMDDQSSQMSASSPSRKWSSTEYAGAARLSTKPPAAMQREKR